MTPPGDARAAAGAASAPAEVKRVLIVEDNEGLALGLRNNLQYEGYATQVAGTAAAGLEVARAGGLDLIILDLMLPDSDGYRVLRALRESGDETPVLVLTALGEEADKVRGFRLGADDYVTKPFGLMELLARVEALLRRAEIGKRAAPAPVEDDEPERFGDVAVYAGTRTVTRRGEIVSLRPKEYELLAALLARRGRIASRLELLSEVWGYGEDVMSRTVDTHVAELRRKLEEDAANPKYLLTVRKTGYRLARE